MEWCGLSCGTVRKLPLAWGAQLVLIVGVTSADVAADAELAAVVGVMRLIVWDGVHVAACVGRAVCSFCRPGGGRGGAVCLACTLRLVLGVQFLLFVGVTVAGVVRFVPRDGAHVGVCD